MAVLEEPLSLALPQTVEFHHFKVHGSIWDIRFKLDGAIWETSGETSGDFSDGIFMYFLFLQVFATASGFAEAIGHPPPQQAFDRGFVRLFEYLSP